MKNLLSNIIAGFAGAIFAFGLLAWTYTYDTATPAGSDDPKLADDRMREIKAALQERLAIDHKFSLTSTQVSATDTGEHLQITFNAPQATPGAIAASKGELYINDVSAKAELFWIDEDEHNLQLTSAGDLYMGSGNLLGTTASVIKNTTADASDTGSFTMAGGGASGVTRGGEIVVYGDDHATYPGQVMLSPGYSTGTTPAIINANTHLISNVVDPVGDQDASTKKYVDDNRPQAGSAVGTGNITTASTSFVDMTTMSATLTTRGRDVIIHFSASMEIPASATVSIGLVVDSDAVIQLGHVTNDMGDRTSTDMFHFTYRVSGLSAGSHTFKVQWKTSGGTAKQDGATSKRSLVAIEI